MTSTRVDPTRILTTRLGTAPKAEDIRVAQALALKIVNAGAGMVRRVVMIGSRAGGYARPNSDLDLVAILELPSNAKPWNGADADAERDRIQAAVGTPPVSTDLTVRSAEQFEEARAIIGGVERLVETEGVDIYSEPFQHPAKARRSPRDVRDAITRAWVEAAANSVAKGIQSMRLDGGPKGSPMTTTIGMLTAPAADGVLRFVVRQQETRSDESSHWSRSIRQAITALEVLYQVEAAKHDSVTSVLVRLDAFCPAVTREVRRTIELHGASLRGAKALINLVIDALPAGLRKSTWAATIRQQVNAHTWLK